MAELAHAQLRSEIAMKELKKTIEEETRKTEECHRKTEASHRLTEESHRKTEESHRLTEESLRQMKADTRAMKKAWGDLANKMGTVAEDVVAPNIPRLAVEEFGFTEVEDLLVRARRVSRRGEKRRTEYDVICSGPGKVIVVDVKSTPTLEKIRDVAPRLVEFFDFYPEYEGRELIGMFASWAIDEKLLPAISEAGLFGLAMGEDTMEIVARPVA